MQNQPESSERILNSIRRIVQELRVSSRAVEKDLGLSAAQLFVLQKLGESEVLSINELAERTLTHQSSVSVVVQRLIEQGWARSSPSPEDRRRTEVSLSAAGRRLLRKAPRSVSERLIEGMKELSVSEQLQMAQWFERIARAAGLSEKAPPMFFEEKTSPDRHNKSRRAAPASHIRKTRK